jgi:hypothetical protein
MATLKVPVRTVFDGSDNPIGLAEFQIGEVVPIVHGGTSANTVNEARVNLSVDDANIRKTISVTGAGSYDNSTGVITITGGVTSVAGVEGAVSNVALVAGIVETGQLTTANVSEVTNLYFTNARAQAAFTAGDGISISEGTISVANTLDYGLIDGAITSSNDYGSI